MTDKKTKGIFWIEQRCTDEPFYEWERITPLIKEYKQHIKEIEAKLIQIMEYDKKNYSDMSFEYRILEEKIEVIKVIKGDKNDR